MHGPGGEPHLGPHGRAWRRSDATTSRLTGTRGGARDGRTVRVRRHQPPGPRVPGHGPHRRRSTRACSGMPLVKTIELPVGMGQHFFFDCGGGDCLAFFWFPDAPEPAPGVSAPRGPARPGRADQRHRVDEPRRLRRARRAHRRVPRPAGRRRRRLHRGRQPRRQRVRAGRSEMHPGVFVRSVYFQDPDGILLEFAAWTRRPAGGPDDGAPRAPAGAVARPAATG